MNLRMESAVVRQCGIVRQYEPRCVAVPTAVCGSVLGSVWQCARQCAAVRHCGSLRQYRRQCSHCVAVRMAAHDSMRQCAW
jgi:hypothetical protein